MPTDPPDVGWCLGIRRPRLAASRCPTPAHRLAGSAARSGPKGAEADASFSAIRASGLQGAGACIRGQAGVSRLARTRLRFVLPHKFGDYFEPRAAELRQQPESRVLGIALPNGSVSLARFPSADAELGY
jgi:hypothetical protein